MGEHKIRTVENFVSTTPVVMDANSMYVNARLNPVSLDEVRQIIREEIRAALKERD